MKKIMILIFKLTLDSNNHPHISYYDYSNGDLKYAEWTGSDWDIQTVDSNGNIGEYTSIDLDSNDHPHISYYDYSNYNLKYAEWTGSDWDIQTVDSTEDVGWDTSIVLDSDNHPHISYSDNTNTNLKYAKWTGSDWNIRTVDSSGAVGWHTSIDLDSNDHPHISYMDYSKTGDGDLKYARWTGLDWELETVDSYDIVGLCTSIGLDSNDHPHISYYDGSNVDLKYAKWTGSEWDIQTVDSNGDVGGWTSIDLDSGDYPHISYYDSSKGDLKYAKWTGSEWDIQTVDSNGNVGGFTSIVLDSYNHPHISYLDYSNGDLKYAKWNSGNVQPVADFSWFPTNPNPGQTTTFDASDSYDPDGNIIEYQWDWNNDGTYDESHSTPTATHSWSDAGYYPVELTVIDNEYEEGDITQTVQIGSQNQPPNTPIITSGQSQGVVNRALEYYSETTDPDGDALYYKWDSGDGGYSGWYGTYNNGESCGVSISWLNPGTYDVRVKAKDSDGAMSEWSQPFTVTITVNHPPTVQIKDITPFPVKINEPFKLIAHAEDPDGDDILEYRWYYYTFPWLIYKLLGSSTEPEFNCESGFPTPLVYALGVQCKDESGEWSKFPKVEWKIFPDMSQLVALDVVDCDHLIRSPYSFSWNRHNDDCKSSADKDSGEISVYVKDGFGHQDATAILGGRVNLGGSSEHLTTFEATAKFVTQGGKKGGAYSYLSVGAKGGGMVDYFGKNKQIDKYWDWSMIIGVLLEAIGWISIFNPAEYTAVQILINYLKDELYKQFVEKLVDLTSDYAFNQALRKEGRTYILKTPKLSACYNTDFIAQAYAKERSTSSPELLRTAQVVYIAVNEIENSREQETQLTFSSIGPVELEITDAGGSKINQTYSNITGGQYFETDLSEKNGNYVYIPNAINGTYEISVLAWENASDNNNYSLIVNYELNDTVIAENISIADIPNSPYTYDVNSLNPPLVLLHYPYGYETLNGTVIVEWSINDYEDGNNLPVFIYYSKDNGSSWSLLDEVDNTGEYVWNTSLLPDGNYLLKVQTEDNNGNIRSETTEPILLYNFDHIPGSVPNQPDTPIGQDVGAIDYEYQFTSITSDSDNDQIYYWFDWGDENNSGWIGPFNSNEECIASHAWFKPGVYNVRVKVQDEYGFESNWSEPSEVVIINESDLTKIIYIGLISKFKSDDSYYSFDAKILLWMVLNPFNFGLYHSGEKIVVSKDYIGFLWEPFALGWFNSYVISATKNCLFSPQEISNNVL